MLNETDITIIIVIMIVMIMLEEVQNQSSFFMHNISNIKVHQLIFTNTLIRTTMLKLVKKQ